MHAIARLGLLAPLAAAALLSLATGCTPASTYRYTGMVPAAKPIPFDGRTSEKGTARVEGTFTGQMVQENAVPVLHDSALHVPQATVEGSGTYAITNGVELGVRFSYASYGWTAQTASGTTPIPDKPSLIGVGPEMRSSIKLDRQNRMKLGIAWNLMRYALPIAEWERVTACSQGATCYIDPLTTGGPTQYEYRKTTGQQQWLLSLSVLLSYAFGVNEEFGHVFGGLAAHPTFGNDGFTDSTSTNGKIETKGWTPIVLAGYGIKLHPARIGASLFFPLGGDEKSIMYGMGAQLTVGVELGGPSNPKNPGEPTLAKLF